MWMAMAEVKEVIPSLNTRSDSGRVVINPPEKMAAPLELHTVDQIRLCCNRAFLTFDSYLKHKEESPSCSPGIILEPIRQDRPEDDDEEAGLFPVIQSVSSVPGDESQFEMEDIEITPTDYDDDPDVDAVGNHGTAAPIAPVVSEALRRLSLSPVRRRVNAPSWATLIPKITEDELPLSAGETESYSKNENDPSQSDVEYEDIDYDQVLDIEKKDTKRTYKCTIEGCHYYANSPDTIRGHLRNSHNPDAQFPCRYCPYRYFRNDRLALHLLHIHSEVAEPVNGYVPVVVNSRIRYNCRFCSYFTSSATAVKKHIWAAHESNGEFQCKLCCCRYLNRIGLKQHIRLFHSEEKIAERDEITASVVPKFRSVIVGGRIRFKCTSCGQSAPNKVAIRNHIERVHNSSDKFSCHYCPSRYSTKDELNQHVKLNHNPKVSSKIGSKETQKSPVPIPSIMVNGSRRYTCSDCEFYTNDMGAMNRHLQTAHNPAATFSCRLCSCRYITKRHLNRHVMFTHVVQDETIREAIDGFKIPEYKVVTVKGYKRYKCQICKHVKKSELEIAKHVQRSHVADGEFPCSLCSCRFGKKGGLTLHMSLYHHKESKRILPDKPQSSKTKSVDLRCANIKIKTGGQKSFKCQLCSYRSNRKVVVLQHLNNAHVPGGGFPCPFCTCCYSFNANLQRHVRRYHPKGVVDVENTASTVETSDTAFEQSSIQNETMTYTCDVKACSYSCNDIRSIRFHKQHAHNPNGKFACRFCSCRYEKSRSLSHHLVRQHGFRQGKPNPERKKIKQFRSFVKLILGKSISYKCSTKGCVYRTNTTTQIKWHIQHSHSQDRKFLCPWCSCRFSSDGSNWKKHCRSHHPTESISNPSLSNQPLNERRITQANKTPEEKSLTGDCEENNEASGRKCPIKGCTVVFRAEQFTNKIKGHLKRAHSPGAQFKCTLCPCRYHGSKGLNIHFTVAHRRLKVDSKEETLEEKKVENRPTIQNKFKQKQSTNSSNGIKCGKCSHYVAPTKWGLENHIKIAHVASGTHKCTRCTCRFSSSQGLKIHFYQVHDKKRKSKFQEPDVKSVINKRPVSVLKRLQAGKSSKIVPSTDSSEEISKNKKIYSCDLCGQTFLNNVSKNWHLKCAHSKWTSNVKRYPCDLCPNVYDSEGGLKIHRSRTHGQFQRKEGCPSSPEKSQLKNEPMELKKRISPRKSENLVESSAEKNSILSALSLFPCSKCDFATQDKKAFEDHNVGSHVPNGMKCVWCSCTFATKMSLVLHQMAQHPNSFDTTGVNWFQRKTGITEAGNKTVRDVSDSNPVDDEDEDSVSKDNKDEAHESQVSDLSWNRYPDVSKPTKTKTLFQCLKCPYTSKFKMNLASHKIISHCKNGFDCDKCPCSFASEKGLIAHKSKQHKECRSSPGTPKAQKNVDQQCISCLEFFPNTTRARFVSHLKLCKRLISIKDLRTARLSQRMTRMEGLEKNIFGLKSTENIETAIDGQDNSNPLRKRNEEKVTTPEIFLKDLGTIDSLKKNTVKKGFSPKIRPMSCKICGTTCRGPENLKIHLQTHTEKTDADSSVNSEKDSIVSDGKKSSSISRISGRHRCDACARIFRTDTELSDHMKVQHFEEKKTETSDGESADIVVKDIEKKYDYDEVEQDDTSKTYKCNLCEYSTEIVLNIRSHFQTSHTDGAFNCERCSCVFQSRMNLFYHKSYFHPGNVMGKQVDSGPEESLLSIGYAVNGILQCSFCLHSCTVVADLEAHYINAHQDQKPEDIPDVDKAAILKIADTCGAERVCMPKKRLSEEKYVVRKIHSCGAAFSDLWDSTECKVCHQKFKKSHEFKHMQLCHSTITTAARCNHCPCRYASKSALQRHVAWSHKLKSSGIVGSVVKESLDSLQKRPFKCQQCGLRFTLEASLDVHQEVSHTIGKHVCVVCSCSLATLFGLDGHMAGAHQVTRNMPVYQEKIVEKSNDDRLLTEETGDFSDAEIEIEDSPRQADESGSSHSFSPLFIDPCISPDPEMPIPSPNSSSYCEDISKSRDVQERPLKRKSTENVKSVVRSVMSTKLRKSTSEAQAGEDNSETCESVKIISKRKSVEKVRSVLGSFSPEKDIESHSQLHLSGMSHLKRYRPGSTMRQSTSVRDQWSSEFDNAADIADRQSMGRPPKRKSAEIASKMIVNLMSETPESETHIRYYMPETIDAVEATPDVEVEYTRAQKRKIPEIAAKVMGDRPVVVGSPKRKAIERTSKTIQEPRSDSETIGSTEKLKTVTNVSEKAESRRVISPTKRKSIDILEKVSTNTTKKTETTVQKPDKSETRIMAPPPSKQKSVGMAAKLPGRATFRVVVNSETVTNEDKALRPGHERPPKRKSAEIATKIIVDVINDEASKKKLESLKKSKRMEWFKEFMKFLCSRCGSSFDSNILLTAHFQSCERRCSKFPCGICFNEFPTLLKLKEHLWKIHKPAYDKTTDPSTSPSYSNKSSSTASPSKDAPKLYTCSLCKLGLKDRKALILHMSVPHLFRCKKCAHVCATKALMETHKLEFHKPKPASHTITINNGTEKKNVEKVRSLRTCRCGIKFSRPSEYEFHKKKCNGESGAQKVPEQSADQESDDDIVFLECVRTPNVTESNNSPAEASVENKQSGGTSVEHGQKKRKQDLLNVIHDYSVICEDKVTESKEEGEPSIAPSDLLSKNSLNSKNFEDSSDSNDSIIDRQNIENVIPGEHPVPEDAECSESLICQDCGYLAGSIEDAREHNSSVGNNESMICDVCAYMATTSCDLKLHSQKNHPTEVNYRASESCHPERIEFSYDPEHAPQYPYEDVTTEPAVQIEVEFHDNIEMENMVCSEFTVAQDIEIRADENISYNDEESAAVVLFNISELETVDQ